MNPEFERVPRPKSETEPTTVSAPRGINRNTLTIGLSLLAVALSLANAGVSYYKFRQAEERKTIAEAKLAEVEERIKSIDNNYQPRIKELELANLESNARLQREQLLTERTAQHRNNEQAALATSQRRSEDVRGEISNVVVKPLIPSLKKAVECGMDCNTPTTQTPLPMFNSSGSRGRTSDDPMRPRNTSPAPGSPEDPMKNTGIIK